MIALLIWILSHQANIFSWNIPLHEKPYFLFPSVLKRWSFQKCCTGIWYLLYSQETWYFFFPKISSYSLNGKWKMILLKKILGNMIFSLDGKWNMIFLRKYMEMWERVSTILCTFMELFIVGVFIYCFCSEKTRKPNM